MPNILLTKLCRSTIVFAFVLSSTVGCNSSTPVAENPISDSATSPSAQATGHRAKHDAWWCQEHGVPEEQCGRCDSKLAADFQKRWDWCQDHDRPDTQCFPCHPELQEQFASLYVAKYGKAPPPTRE